MHNTQPNSTSDMKKQGNITPLKMTNPTVMAFSESELYETLDKELRRMIKYVFKEENKFLHKSQENTNNTLNQRKNTRIKNLNRKQKPSENPCQ